MAWMITGILLSAILTSTMTNVFDDVDYMNIRDKEVVAVRGSLEEFVAKKYFNAEVIRVPDYASLYDKIASSVLSIGVVNTDVHWHYAEKHDSLKTVKRLGSGLEMLQIIHTNDDKRIDYQELYHCLLHLEDAGMIDIIFKKHKKVTKEVKLQFEEKLIDFIFANPAVLSLAIIATVFIFLGIVLECTYRLHTFFQVKKCASVVGVKHQTRIISEKRVVNERESRIDMAQVAWKEDMNELKFKIDEFNQKLESINVAVEYLNKKLHAK